MQLFIKAAVIKINYYDNQEDHCCPGCDVKQYDKSLPTLQRNLLPPSSGQNKKPGMENNCMDTG
jgi:hypothetical protein